MKLLVESGASTRFETKDGKLPICYAASYNHADVLSYLMHKEHGTQYLMDDKKVDIERTEQSLHSGRMRL